MPPVDACAPLADLTCEQKEALEEERSTDVFERLLAGGANIPDVLQLLIFPPWASNPDDQLKALIHYLTEYEICRPDNNAMLVCPTEDPCEDPFPNYCDDPEQCPSKVFGYGLLEIIKAAIRADSMAYVPYAHLDAVASGEGLVWDPTQTPENADCDPCRADVFGAFVPVSAYEAAHPD